MAYTAEISSSAIYFAMGLLACVAVIMLVADFEEKFGRCMYGFSCKIHNADFSDARIVRGTDEICSTEGWHYECGGTCGIGAWNQLCRPDYCNLDYEENKVAGVLLVSKPVIKWL